MTDQPPEDRAPDFPPGPRGPEDLQPGARFVLNRGQLETIAAIVADHGYSTFELEQRGSGYYTLRLIDAEGNRTSEHTIFPLY
jgi:hypothetical protein